MFKTLILRFSDIFDREFTPGAIIDERYRHERLLGVGGYGRSYLVYDLIEGKHVVLKALRLHKRMTQKGRKGFFQEKEILKSFQHPSFPAYYLSGEVNGIPYFTMEYIFGHTFEQLIFSEGETYNEFETFRIAVQLIQIIGYLHNNQIVHRDIRIPNVMIQDGKLKLIDFGLAKRLDINAPTRQYLPKNRLKEVAVQSDFYGVGHFILFLLYSGFQSDENVNERSWQDELELSSFSIFVIRKLLQLEEPYENWKDIQNDILKIITE